MGGATPLAARLSIVARSAGMCHEARSELTAMESKAVPESRSAAIQSAGALRTVESCPYRLRLPSSNGDDRAQCELLAELLGAAGRGRCEVGREVCLACVDAFPPTREDINQVIASLLVKVTTDVLDSEGMNGHDGQRMRALREWAISSIPVMYPDEVEEPGVPPENLRSEWVALDQTIPRPSARSGPVVAEWAVGITTAPRRLPTLEYCLSALLAAGWNEPRLFVDEAADLPARFSSLAQSIRQPRLGAWPNYYLSLAELTLRQPDADAYMILQDDALLVQHPGLRQYLEGVLWPGDRPGIVSLYCAREYTQANPGWYALPMQWFWGALAFIFPAELARRFLADPEVIEHRRRKQDGLVAIDVLVGRFAHRHNIPVSFPTPSLVQHIGQVSTLWQTARATGTRRAGRFAGDPELPPRPLDQPSRSIDRSRGVRFFRSIDSVIGTGIHRSGWPYAVASLQQLADSGGILLDDFVEQSFCYPHKEVVHTEPWVGIFHHPPNMPPFMISKHNLTQMFQNRAWKQSRPHLIGAIALSEYLATYLGDCLGVPSFSLRHPTEVPDILWDPSRYEQNPSKQLIQVGWYLKNTQLLYQIPDLPDHIKLRLLAGDGQIRVYDWKVARYWKEIGGRKRPEADGVRDQCRVTPYRYDCLLAENVVAIELFDSSANNVVIECIARHTPIFVNRHPAVVEYLGAEYPLYFSDPAEIPALLRFDRVLAAHEYLKRLEKPWLDGGYFRESLGAILRAIQTGRTKAGVERR